MVLRHRPSRGSEQPERKQAEDRHEIDVGGDAEHGATLPDPPQVDHRDRDHEGDPEVDPVVEQLRHERGQRGDPGGDRDCDRQHVVSEERARGHQARLRPEVVLGDDVRAATVWVGGDRLLVARHNDRQDHHDPDRDRHREGERAGAGEHEDAHDLLGRVRRGRDVVRGEHREADEDVEPFGQLFVERDRATEEDRSSARQGSPDRRPRHRRRFPRHERVRTGVPEVRGVGAIDADPPISRLAAMDRATTADHRAAPTKRCTVARNASSANGFGR